MSDQAQPELQDVRSLQLTLDSDVRTHLLRYYAEDELNYVIDALARPPALATLRLNTSAIAREAFVRLSPLPR